MKYYYNGIKIGQKTDKIGNHELSNDTMMNPHL